MNLFHAPAEVVVCPDCGADLWCYDGDFNAVLEVHAMQDCEGP